MFYVTLQAIAQLSVEILALKLIKYLKENSHYLRSKLTPEQGAIYLL